MAWGMKNITIQLFGSSIMEGRIGVERAADRWYEKLRGNLSEHFPDTCFSIINSAVGAESTRELMAHFNRDMTGRTPNFILVMFGANNTDYNHPERILKPGEMNQWMESFLQRIPQTSRVTGVILNPVKNEWHSTFHEPAYQEALRKAGGLDALLEPEREEARSFFRRHGLPFLDLHELLQPVEKYVCPEDGIHLNPEAHRLFAEKMTEMLSGMIS